MSTKINRLESSLLKEISYILATEIKDEKIKHVTITAVKITKDLSLAKIYVSILDETKKDETIESLNKAKGFIRTRLHEKIEIRQIPKLEFIYDESISYGVKIENIIKDINQI